MNKLLIVLAFLFSSTAWADHVVLGFGPSIHNFQSKSFSVGYEKTFKIPLSIMPSCGVLTDAQPVFTCSLVTSVRVENSGGWFARVGVGPAFVSRTTDRLSSIFEYHIRYAFGLYQNGWSAGLEGAHMSNLSPVFNMPGPNRGEDTISLMGEIAIPGT